MSLQVWLPLNKDPNVIPAISSFYKESYVTLTEDSDGWYKVSDSYHTNSSRWGIYYNFEVKSNTTYTLMVYSKSTTGVSTSVGIQSFDTTSGWPSVRDTNTTSTEKLTTYTWTTGENHTIARIYLAINTSTTIDNNYVFFKEPVVWETPHSQGIVNTTVMNSGATYSSTSGKLGGCYSFDGTDDRIYANNVSINNSAMSACCWVKFNNLTSSDYPYIFALGSNTSGTGIQIGLAVWKSDSKIHLVGNGSEPSSGYTPPTNTWIHLCITINGATTKLYVNGILTSTQTNANSPKTQTCLCLGARPNSTNGAGTAFSYPINGYINDFRLYDHCLSPMEVKQLSQGLVLHYPLSDKFLEGTTNLITTEDCLSSICYNGAISKYNYGTNTDMYKTVTTYDGRKGTKVYMGTNGNSAFPYVYVNNMYTSDGTNSPAYKTLSFDYYGTVGNYLGPYPLGSGTGTATYKITCKDIETTGSYSGYGFFPVTPNEWNHIEVTFHGTTEADAQWGYIRIGNSSHTSNTSNFWFFANMQLETKDHATGYAGVGGTRNSNIVYDTSGFCNNGTISGALTISDDTPKYRVSTAMLDDSATRYIYADTQAQLTKEITMSCWFKQTESESTTGTTKSQVEFVISQGRDWYTTGCSLLLANGAPKVYAGNVDEYAGLTHDTKLTGSWHHMATTYKDGTLKLYVDGTLSKTGACGDLEYTYAPKFVIGKMAYSYTSTGSFFPYIGYISDVRIYATALSADDVLSLYKNSNPT